VHGYAVAAATTAAALLVVSPVVAAALRSDRPMVAEVAG
jgi:hypothetical protein